MIWHLLPLSRWQSAGSGPYVPGTAETVPFVHASPDEPAALAVANAWFAESAEPLVALGLEESRLSAPVRLEPADPVPPPGVAPSTLFPHIYGPVEITAVTEVRYARRDPSGRYASLDARPATAEALDLVPHPEGGWFRETWAAGPAYTPSGYPGRRAAATGIYFLLTPGSQSVWHLVRSDELWLWHAGGPLTLLLGGAGERPAEHPEAVSLGPDLARGERPQHVVRGGCWQAAYPAGPQEALVSCVVAPGFDFADFTALPGEPARPPADGSSPR
ncbi:MAG TPA: cupin domain-containing protein [Streptosporangiaceae bacterium]|nr:cupin domain-containing protein [Streptosporangiaceae bacterium]